MNLRKHVFVTEGQQFILKLKKTRAAAPNKDRKPKNVRVQCLQDSNRTNSRYLPASHRLPERCPPFLATEFLTDTAQLILKNADGWIEAIGQRDAEY
jgi:hypothetical protein